MEVREKYIAKLLSEPESVGFTELKFIHTPQIAPAKWVRLRCQYLCSQTRQSDLCPPFSPTVDDTEKMMMEYRFGLLIRREIPLPATRPMPELWGEFEHAMIEAETEAFVRGYGKAFALGVGNCLFCHHDDSMRPCEFPGKRRPTLEAIGVNLYDTLDMAGWDHLIIRDSDEPFQMFGLLLLE